jgi:hypothetical protein
MMNVFLVSVTLAAAWVALSGAGKNSRFDLAQGRWPSGKNIAPENERSGSSLVISKHLGQVSHPALLILWPPRSNKYPVSILHVGQLLAASSANHDRGKAE